MEHYNNFENRCEILARYLIENKTTVRETAKKFGISKSTVHKDITDKLSKVNFQLHKEVEEILQINKLERHLRGGEATKKKYLLKNWIYESLITLVALYLFKEKLKQNELSTSLQTPNYTKLMFYIIRRIGRLAVYIKEKC